MNCKKSIELQYLRTEKDSNNYQKNLRNKFKFTSYEVDCVLKN